MRGTRGPRPRRPDGSPCRVALARSHATRARVHTHTRARATSGRRAALPRGARRVIITHRIQARFSSRDDECSHFAFSTLRPARCLLPLTSARTALSDARILMMADEVQPSAFAAMGGFHSAALRTSRRAAMPLGKLWTRPARVRMTSGQRRAAVHVGRERSPRARARARCARAQGARGGRARVCRSIAPGGDSCGARTSARSGDARGDVLGVFGPQALLGAREDSLELRRHHIRLFIPLCSQ